MALSRIGLWSFDLAQLTQLQEALDTHSRPNVLAALQISLQNVFTLGAYALTLGWNAPRDFKYAAAVCHTSIIRSSWFIRKLRYLKPQLSALPWYTLTDTHGNREDLRALRGSHSYLRLREFAILCK
jgi:hypothetical protein